MASRSHFCLWVSVSFLLDCFFFSFLFFNWGTGALQCCVINSFYCIAEWISYRHTHVPSLQCFPQLPPPSLEVITERWAELPMLFSRSPLSAWCRDAHIHQPKPPSSPLSHSCVHLSVLFIRVSISALQIGSSRPFFFSQRGSTSLQ